MPFKTKKKFTTKRRKTFKRKPARATTRPACVSVGRSILPRRLFTKLKYVSDNLANSTTTGMPYYDFAANGLFAPEVTGGHQPYGFDQLALIYNDYRVHGCAVKVTGRMLTSGQTGIVALGFNGSSTVLGGIGACMESVKNVYRTVNYQDVFVLKKYGSIANIFGKSKTAINGDSSYAAGVGANPATIAYVMLYYTNSDETTSTAWEFRVELTYLVEFNDLKVLAQS